MTEQAYLQDSYARSFRASVERVLDDRIVLDRTHFYPEGGGQPADRGMLVGPTGRYPVIDVQKRDTVYHEIAGTTPSEGVAVRGILDWDRRYAHMRFHTAQHLISAALLDEFDAETTGNQLYEDRARIDCAYDRFTDEDLRTLEAAVNEHVQSRLRVSWYELDRDVAEAQLDPERTRLSLLPDSIKTVRIVEIDGVDRTACAGTHVRNTESVGAISVTGRETKGSDEERVHFELDT
jgi:misacylated tRNA(Ala) deacylase